MPRESGLEGSGILYIHGTVVANTDSWVFFYTFLSIDRGSHTISARVIEYYGGSSTAKIK